jgi:hypothetical protein
VDFLRHPDKYCRLGGRSHVESGAFTTATKKVYAKARKVAEADVELGTYKFGQGVPSGGETEEI